MQRQSDLFDRAVLARNRARAAAAPDPAVFLHEEAALEVSERLTLVYKPFTDQAIVTAAPGIWQRHLPGAAHVADADVLALAPQSQDLVVHGMALHWANDPVGQLIQCRRALRPDGLFLGVQLGGQTLAELRAVLAETETEITGGLSPRVAPMAEIRDLGALLQRAGFAMPVADAQTLTVTYRDAYALMRDLRAMGETNALAGRLRRPTRRAVFDRAAQRYAEAFPAEGGRIRATFELITLTGWAPAESQPKPLRPGSATARLADALGTAESKLPTGN